MLFDDLGALKKRSQLRELPPIPDEAKSWRPPAEFPNLGPASVLSFDVETKETDFDHGPGWARKRGHIVGFSIAAQARDGARGAWYFPLRHEVEKEYNLDPAQCLGWLKAQLETPNVPKVGANLLYDIGWLTEENIYVRGELHDVQFAEALIDEQGEVNLDYLCTKYGVANKDTGALYKWLADAYGLKKLKQREDIYRASPRLVGPYGVADADRPLRILDRQYPVLLAENLEAVYRMECRLIPLLVQMRMAGVSVNLDFAHKLYDELGATIEQLYAKLAHTFGMRVESVSAGAQLARLFDHVGVEYPRTAAGAPSFQKEWLAGLDNPLGKAVNEIREHEKIRGTFVKSYLLESAVPTRGVPGVGKVFCQFHPLRGEDGGAKTGRFSSSDPNLQNIPSRTDLGKRIREAFIPDPSHAMWRRFDYSQIEYRMLAHFAVNEKNGRSADLLRDTYLADPTTDYHQRVMIAFAAKTGRDLSTMTKDQLSTFRKPIKNVNFGLLYGQSEKSLAYKAGMTPQQSKEFFADYHSTNPYVKATMEAIAEDVQRDGFICTIMGRRTRFNLWEPRTEFGKTPVPYDQAIRYYGSDIVRSFAYRGTNYKFQGSAADVMKAAMLAAFEAGVFDVIGVPRLTVHDELDFTVIAETHEQEEAYKYLAHLLETSTPTNIPIKVDREEGPNWGQAK